MNEGKLDPIIGQTLGDFLVKEKLGEGGFGAVYKAEQITLARKVAIKVLHTNHRANKEIIERFKREAFLASRLEHPYAAHIYAFGVEADGLMWIAMEFIQGTPLDKLIKTQGSISLERFVPLLDKICEVIHTAHEMGIVHRDIKPANVMMIVRAGRLLPKLLDFGIAKGLPENSTYKNTSKPKISKPSNIKNPNLNSSENTSTKTQIISSAEDKTLIKASAIDTNLSKAQTKIETKDDTVSATDEETLYEVKTEGIVGSPAYMSPEQWKSSANVDARSDIYSLGVLTYQVLTGQIPQSHANKPVLALGENFPPALNKVIEKVLAKEPTNRYQTVLEFAKEFREASGFNDHLVELPQLDEFLKENLLANAPKPIADTIANLLISRNVYQFRDRLLLVFKVWVRYLGVLTLASYARVSNKEPNKEIVINGIRNLHKKGLSDLQWGELCRELTRPFAKNRDVFPVPELVSLFFLPGSEQLDPVTEDFAKILKLKQEINSNVSEEQLVVLLADFLATLTKILKKTSWLSDYYLTLSQNQQASKWMGTIKKPRSITIKTNNLPDNKPMLVDSEGYYVLSLGPLVEIAQPTPNAPLEVFLLEGRGRSGAKLVTFPDGFEIETEAPWKWLKEHFFTDEEKLQTHLPIEKSPYLGLTSFSVTDSAIFFGREKETENLLNRLRIQPLLVVIGPSGAGKSSFIQAGVIASLDENWQVITLRPGLSPITTLSTKLAKAGIELSDLKTDLQKDPEILATNLRQFAIKQNKAILLVIDQFEEIITLCLDKQEQSLYVKALVLATRSEEDPVRVVLTMRDDFLVRAKELPGLKDRLAQSLEILSIPDSEQLLRILIEPAKRVGYEFEDRELPIEIVNQVTSQTSALPLIAFTAAKLWEQRDTEFKQLQRKTYEKMGGVVGALARHAESILQQMPQNEQSLVREAFRHLVTSEGTKAILTRTELFQLLGKTTNANSVIEKLISSRLLVTTEGEKGVDRIEIIHEALLSAWPRLLNWRQETIEGARLHDQLRAAAHQWKERNYPKGLLWRDEALTEYQLWKERYKGKLTELEEEFAQASLSEATRSQLIKRRLLTTVIIVLIIGVSTLFYQQKKTKEQLSKTLELYEEQSRQEIIKGNLDGAAVYLSEAYANGANSLAIRYMLAVALAKVENNPPITLTNHTDSIMMAAFSPDDQKVVSASADKTARIWQTNNGKELFILKGHTDTVLTAKFSPDGRHVVTSSLDKTAKIWNVEDGSLVATLTGHEDALLSAILSPDAKQVITISYDKTAKIWDTSNGKLLSTLTGHEGAIYAVSYSNDSKLIATASADKTARIWSSSGELKTILRGHQASIIDIAFSPDLKLLATASVDATARIWKISTSELVHTLAIHKEGITSVKFSSDGKALLTTSKDKTACLWDTKTGNLVHTLTGHQDDVGTGCFSPNGNLIITSAYDNTARVWESTTSKFLVTLGDHEDSLSSAMFSSNGEKALTASLDGTIKIWSLIPETRLPDEISALVKEKVPVDLKEGRLVAREQKLNNEEENTVNEPKLVENKTTTIVEMLDNAVKIEMVKIEGGTFEMGSPLDEKARNGDEQQHKVTLSPFYIGKYEVTQAQWKVVANLPVIKTFLVAHPSRFKGDNLPVEQITWEEAVEFCARLSKFTGKNYRLPTEAEWEYAVRAGNKGTFVGNLDDVAWYEKNSGRRTHTVGQKQPNKWGIYDMYGNVFEWCSDWYEVYSDKPVIDPKGPASGTSRVFRGGGCAGGAAYCRLANRTYDVPNYRNYILGFRLAMTDK